MENKLPCSKLSRYPAKAGKFDSLLPSSLRLGGFSASRIKALNYRVIVEKEHSKKGFVYVAYAPTLGISDFGKTVEQAVDNIEKAIKLYIETMVELKKPVSRPDEGEYFVTTRKIEMDLPIKNLAFD